MCSSDLTLVPPALARLRTAAWHASKEGGPVLRRLATRMLPALARAEDAAAGRALTRALAAPGSEPDFALAVEFHSLHLLERTGFDLARCAYISLESVDVPMTYGLRRARDLLSRCGLCIIQSPEREADFRKHFGLAIPFEHLPVSMRPVPEPAHPAPGGPLRVLHSGYLCDWACVREFLDMAAPLAGELRMEITARGHCFGTKRYYEGLEKDFGATPGVALSRDFIGDDEFMDFLGGHNVGLALYKGDPNSPNWQNLLFSSGKTAAYLWAGLAVMTNIDHPLTRKPPFLYLDAFEPDRLRSLLADYAAAPETYRAAARALARERYDLDAHMRRILERLAAGPQRP